ncbi:MAG TPA: hypothetical protein VNZ03_35890 [Terriglobales bacterium]|jgi:hypothetical protein|nr:hypothetical protein [Terriglobales bacterium]
MDHAITEAKEWSNKLQAVVGDNGELWDEIGNVKTGTIGLTCEAYAYAEFADGSLLADGIDADRWGLQKVYTTEAELLKDLSDQQESAMWQAAELGDDEILQAVHAELNGYYGPPLTGTRIELMGVLTNPEDANLLDIGFELTQCQHLDGTPCLFSSTDYKELRHNRVEVAYREDLKQHVGKKITLTAQEGHYDETRATERGNTFQVQVPYLFAVDVRS